MLMFLGILNMLFAVVNSFILYAQGGEVVSIAAVIASVFASTLCLSRE